MGIISVVFRMFRRNTAPPRRSITATSDGWRPVFSIRIFEARARAGRQAVVADAVETVEEDMNRKAADELACIKTHDLHAIPGFDPIVLTAECPGIRIGADEATVRVRHATVYRLR